jgi:membrane-bound serine protease (ClpP class)
MIDDFVAQQLKVRFDRAKADGAKVIILEIDTYGGLVGAGLDISRFLKNQNDVKVIGFINSKAISAGAMIALACDEIVMTPSATFGDCAPIQVGPSGEPVNLEPTERSKAESPILSDFQESARKHGYDPLLAVCMVSLPYTAHWIENADGKRRFVDADEYKSLTATGDWKPVAGEPNPIDGPTTLLTLHTEQAIKYGMARSIATSADDLAKQANLTIVARYENGWGANLVAILSSTITRTLLIIVFINALFIGLKTPGTGAAEAIALTALAVLVGVPLLTGYAEWGEILLILAGIALIAVEIFVFPGHFVSLIVGGLMVLTGIMLTFVGDIWRIPGSWSMPQTWDGLQNGIQVTVVGLVCSMLLMLWLRAYLPKLPYFNKLILPLPETLVASPAAAETSVAVAGPTGDAWPFAGTIGTASSDLKPGGTVRFPFGDDSRVASVVSMDGYVPAGAKVVVDKVRGSEIVVRAVR